MKAVAAIGRAEDVIPVTPDWQALCEEHLEFVHRALRRLAGPGVEVDDLVQEVFLVAQRRAGAFEGRSAATSWLYGICLKVVAGHRRRAWFKALLHHEGPEAAAQLPAEDDPSRGLARQESERLVYEVLGTMSEKRRTVLILYELEELSGEEIARILGCPVKTVWTRLHHARREFKEKVQARLGPGEIP